MQFIQKMMMGTGNGGGQEDKEVAPRSPTSPSKRKAKKNRKLKNDFDVETKILGEGHYGTVRPCVRKTDGLRFAVKSINKSRVSKPQMLASEIQIMLTVDHPNIIKVIDIYDEKEFLHIVTELCTGGELFERIIEKSQSSEKSFSERDAAKVLRQILDAVAYCHDLGISHRDLKPENFLFLSKSDEATLKVIDFGLGKLSAQDPDNASSTALMHTRVGTPYYIAPEVLRRDYTVKCDIWSIGVIAYILLCGYPPFYGDNDRDIFRRVSAGKYQFPSPEWDHISRPAKDFVAAMLRLDIDRRPSAREALNHHWLAIHSLASPVAAGRSLEAIPESDSATKTTTTTKPRAATDKEKLAAVARRMRRFVRMTKLKRLALNVLSRELTGSELEHLHSVFRKIDKDGDGHITAAELHDALHDHLGFSEKKSPSEKDDEHIAMIHQLMQAIDLSGDQKIDYPEFLAATMQRTAYLKEENMKKVFAQLDIDKTGYVTFQNLIDITGSKKHAADLLKEADVNNDRKISYQEFKDIMTSKH